MTQTLNGHEPITETAPQTLTFSTGVTVMVRPLALLTLQAIGAAVRRDPSFQAPEPPIQEVQAIDGMTRVANPDAPSYQAALREHGARVTKEISRRVMRLIARRAVELAVDAAWVATFRDDMAAIGSEVEGEDTEVYLYHYAAATPDDIAALQMAVLRRSQPTEAAVAEHAATFPGDVQGP